MSKNNPLDSISKPFVSGGNICYKSDDYVKYWKGGGDISDDNFSISYNTSHGGKPRSLNNKSLNKKSLLSKSKNTLTKLQNKSYQITKSLVDVPIVLYDDLLHIVQTVLDDAKGLSDYLIKMARFKGGGKKVVKLMILVENH